MKHVRNFILPLLLLLWTGLAFGQKPFTILVGDQAKPICPDLFGLFFEDINYAADGGLYAELVQNRSFEYSRGDNRNWNSLTSWQLLQSQEGAAAVDIATDNPLNANNPHYAVLTINTAGNRNGLNNEGFDGIVLKKGDQYDVSLFARIFAGSPGTITVAVESPAGQVAGQTQITGLKAQWTKHTGVIQAKEDVANGKLVVLVSGSGTLGLDMISLFPQKTFKNRPNGLRADLAQVIADLKPKFIRFPGGCLAHGDGLENMYRWKDTIGPVEQRKAQRNIWRYHQTLGLGYYEYFQFCEDIGARPLPVVPAGVCCQNSGNYLNLVPRGQQGIPMEEMADYVQEVLDLIEWANGPATSRWGAQRAAAGHPEPFNLKYLGVGNEDVISPVFKARYKMINDAIKAKHPEIVVIGTTGPFTDGEDYEEGWKFAREENLPMVDEHGYKSPDWYWQNLERFDGYERTGTQVYLGEYAAHEGNRANTLRSALAEAAYMATLERNGDLVALSSYAPLLSKRGRTQWTPDMIYFDNTTITKSTNYFVQQLFSCNHGDVYLPTRLIQESRPAEAKPTAIANGVILGTWNTQATFDDLTVVSGPKTLLKEDFSGELKGWNSTAGQWRTTQGAYTQAGGEMPALTRYAFTSDPAGYTITLRAKKTGGAEGFLIGFGAQDTQNYYWLNLGGWNNTAHAIEKAVGGGRTQIGPRIRGTIETNRWYDIKIQVTGQQIQCYLDGQPIIDITDRGFVKTPDWSVSTVKDSASGDLILKLVSKAQEPTRAIIDLSALGQFKTKAQCTVLTGDALAVNRFGEPPAILPQASELAVSERFEIDIPAHSLTVLRLNPKP